jgi:hypothetical protein
MFRFLVKVLFIVLPTSLLAEGTARDVQGMLSRLGYQISVDGSWGPQSQRVIGQFYTDRGLTYDGTLSENEFTDLSAAVDELPKIVVPRHPRSRNVDYSVTYDFGPEPWAPVDIEKYAREVRNYYNDDLSSWPYTADCNEYLSKAWKGLRYEDEAFLNNIGKCIGRLQTKILDEIPRHGRNSPHLKYLFETLIPLWSENYAFTAKGWTDNGNCQANTQIAVNNYAFRLYFNFASYYGVTPEMDSAVYRWYEKADSELCGTVRTRYFGKCFDTTWFLKDPGTSFRGGWSEQRTNAMHWNTDCSNGNLGYGANLALAGMYFKNSDYINEALYVMQVVIDVANEDGATHDATRCQSGVGYMAQTSQYIVELAEYVEDLGIDVYQMRGRNHGTTPEDIVNYSAKILMNPELNHRYMQWATYPNVNQANGKDCLLELNRDVLHDPLEMIYNEAFVRFSGLMYNNPKYEEYRRWYEAKRRHMHRGSGNLNMYIIQRVED